MTAIPQLNKAQLVVVNDGTRREIELNQEYTFIGQGPDNDVQLAADQAVSRRHAVITPVGTQFFLCDLVSEHGTSVNGKRISRLVPLAKGDVIEMGCTKMIFELPVSLGRVVAPVASAYAH